MNLNFQSVGKVEKDHRVYEAQRADVTGNTRFWAAWNYAKKIAADADRLHATVPKPDLTSTIRLSREVSNGRLLWAAYRLVPVDVGLPLGTFDLSFTLRDPSGLLAYQLPAVTHLCNSILCHGAAADGSDTGTGKTYHALGVCRNLVLRPAVVCRRAGIAGWQRACAVMKVSPVFIANWEQVKGKDFPWVSRAATRSGSYQYTWRIPEQTMLIFDEAHVGAVAGTLNNRLWLASKGLPSLSLSATFSDRPERMLSLLWILGAISSREEYHKWLLSRGHFVNRYEEFEAVDAAPDMKEINRLLYPRYGYRVAYSDPAVKKFFPDAVYRTNILSLSEIETSRQNALYAETLTKIERYRALGKQADAMVADLRYRQAAELLKCEAVADMVRSYLEQGASVCVFVNFRETLAWFARAFKTNSLIFGDQQRMNVSREDVIAAFQAGKTRLVICMNLAGGQSIDLHDTIGGHPRISLVFPTYDPIVLKQVLGRTYRAGTKSTPVMQLVYAANTIEEKVSEVVNRKLDNISALNEGDLMEPDIFKLGAPREEK